jgi:hypothetical protein
MSRTRKRSSFATETSTFAELKANLEAAEQRLAECSRARELIASFDATVAELRRQLGVPERTQHSAELALGEVERYAHAARERARRAVEAAERVTP